VAHISYKFSGILFLFRKITFYNFAPLKRYGQNIVPYAAIKLQIVGLLLVPMTTTSKVLYERNFNSIPVIFLPNTYAMQNSSSMLHKNIILNDFAWHMACLNQETYK